MPCANYDAPGVFDYIDEDNYWAGICSEAQQRKLLYQVSSRSSAQGNSADFPITAGTPFRVVYLPRRDALGG